LADDKTRAACPHRDRINVRAPFEVREWLKSLGVTQDELREAVDAVGTGAQEIREYLNSK
jgi:hypothetical protein